MLAYQFSYTSDFSQVDEEISCWVWETLLEDIGVIFGEDMIGYSYG